MLNSIYNRTALIIENLEYSLWCLCSLDQTHFTLLVESIAFNVRFLIEYILNKWCMLFQPTKVPLIQFHLRYLGHTVMPTQKIVNNRYISTHISLPDILDYQSWIFYIEFDNSSLVPSNSTNSSPTIDWL